MGLLSFNTILTSAGIITALGGAWYTILKIIRELRKSRKASDDKILDEAREISEALKAKLEARIDILESDLSNLKSNVAKDILHIKEIQSSEIKALGDRIEALREELKTHSTGILNLLTQLVNKN
jgi:ABC-type phosphate transport system auxiliary subunit